MTPRTISRNPADRDDRTVASRQRSPDPQPAEFAGSHTTRSGISAISAGTVTEPARVLTLTRPPALTPASAAVAADILATAGRAVPARSACPAPGCGRPSW